MKKNIFILCFLITSSIYSQNSTLDIIAKKTCEYLESDEIQSLDKSQKSMKLGIFIIQKYSEYKDELVAEGIGIDFSKEDAGRVFGEKVGLTMVNFCPNTLIALAGGDSKLTNNIKEQGIESFVGEIKSIKGDDFSFVQVEGVDGTIQNFLWFSNFKGSEKLISSDLIKGVRVKVKYKSTECFSPKLREYINRKEIVEIEYLN